MRTATVLPLLGINVDRAVAASLHREVDESLRAAILERRLEPGVRLPERSFLSLLAHGIMEA